MYNSDGSWRPGAEGTRFWTAIFSKQRYLDQTRQRHADAIEKQDTREYLSGRDFDRKPAEDTLSYQTEAALVAMRKSSVVMADTMNFGMDPERREASKYIQNQAIESGDIVTQVGYVSGKVGVRATQALIVTSGGMVAIPVVAETSAGATVIGVASSQPANAAYFAFAVRGAAHSGASAIEAGKSGNFIDATDHAGTGLIEFLAARELANGKFAAKLTKGKIAPGEGKAASFRRVAEPELRNPQGSRLLGDNLAMPGASNDIMVLGRRFDTQRFKGLENRVSLPQQNSCIESMLWYRRKLFQSMRQRS